MYLFHEPSYQIDSASISMTQDSVVVEGAFSNPQRLNFVAVYFGHIPPIFDTTSTWVFSVPILLLSDYPSRFFSGGVDKFDLASAGFKRRDSVHVAIYPGSCGPAVFFQSDPSGVITTGIGTEPKRLMFVLL